METEKVLEKFDSIVKAYSKTDKIALIHDLDADGVSSGVLAFHAIKLLRGKEPDLVISQSHKTTMLMPETIEKLKENKINKLITVDFALDQQKDSVKKAEAIVGEILVIDHHKDYELNSKKTFVLKANYIKEIDPSKYPTSKLVYDLFSRHVSLQKFSWLSAVGLIGDNQLDTWRASVEKAVADHSTSIEELFTVSSIITSVEVLVPEQLNDLFYFIASSFTPKQVIDSKYNEYLKKLDSEVERVKERFEKEKEEFGKQELIWFEFTSPHNVKSAVINNVSNSIYPNKTVIFVQDKHDGFVTFSARRQDFKVKTNDLLEKAIEGFEQAGAGGHIPASAGRIKKEDLPEFKKRILEALS